MPGSDIPTHGDPLTEIDVRLHTGWDVVEVGPGVSESGGVVHLTSATDLQRHGVFVYARNPGAGVPLGWTLPAGAGLLAGAGLAVVGALAWRRRPRAGAASPTATQPTDAAAATPDVAPPAPPEPTPAAVEEPPEDPRVWAAP